MSRPSSKGLQAFQNALSLVERAETDLAPREFATLIDIHARRVLSIRGRFKRWLEGS